MSRWIPNQPGDTIGNATLVERIHQDKWRTWWWTWKCLNCGAIKGPSSIQKIKQSKKCRNCYGVAGPNNPRWLGHEQMSGSFLYQYRNDAKKKNREWSVTPENLWEQWLLQDGRCAYTGWTLVHGETASIDRIDSAIGYRVGNIQWVHRDVNRMKSNFTEERFVTLCRAVVG